jgi:putative membrane protein
MMWDWVPWWHWLWMGGAWVVGMGLIIWALTALFPSQPPRDPQQSLDERFAHGELDIDQYRHRRDELDARPHRRSDRGGA